MANLYEISDMNYFSGVPIRDAYIESSRGIRKRNTELHL